ncbi:hypothetical protein DDV22_08865 [Streptococcus chenjunshii]|uniref:Uncharacterized protein n=1 Tax=Streptococcus chenjunshii TaxID=2173853 RepID=A0ABX9L3K3_9STRE|nr:hypothetical protein DDV22_08865 [Streptococcus chenjunshii]
MSQSLGQTVFLKTYQVYQYKKKGFSSATAENSILCLIILSHYYSVRLVGQKRKLALRLDI